jgi:hypothetical protein
MPRWLSPDEIFEKERGDRARAYLAEARRHAEVLNAPYQVAQLDRSTAKSTMASMNALMAIAEMLVPRESETT